jgi:hypothetical protein
MPNYKKIDESIADDFIGSIFRAIGNRLRPAVLKNLSKKDPKFGQLVQDLEKSRAEVDSYIKQKTKSEPLSKSDIKAINRGDVPDFMKNL